MPASALRFSVVFPTVAVPKRIARAVVGFTPSLPITSVGAEVRKPSSVLSMTRPASGAPEVPSVTFVPTITGASVIVPVDVIAAVMAMSSAMSVTFGTVMAPAMESKSPGPI